VFKLVPKEMFFARILRARLAVGRHCRLESRARVQHLPARLPHRLIAATVGVAIPRDPKL